ncbi:MAG: LytS/YhcK type 5TM receptor domain-containing protein [Methyloglobulus sp.]|nr:histidine kinase [Methyloglobulus sp.]
MDFPELPLLMHWLYDSLHLLERFFIVVVAALIAVRFERLRQAGHNSELKWRHQFLAVIIFAILAIIGTHNGIIYEVRGGWRSINLSTGWPTKLEEKQAIIGLRDTITLISGLIGGPFVGLGTGLLAGADRWYLGGLASFPSFIATTVLGLLTGGVRYFKPNWLKSVKIVFWVALAGTVLHRVILLFLIRPFDDAVSLTTGVLAPVAIANTAGCSFLIFWVIKQLDRDRLEKEASLQRMQAEIRAFQAQTEPHFLKGTIASIKGMIRENPENASDLLAELSDFFADILAFSGKETITLEDELEQLERFITFKNLEFNGLLQYNLNITDELLCYQVAPISLLTLVENAINHGLFGRPPPYILSVSVKADGEYLVQQVTNNGHTINPDMLPKLGKQPVASKNRGGGVGLYQMMQSLQLVFGESVELNFQSDMDNGTVAILRHPKRVNPVE